MAFQAKPLSDDISVSVQVLPDDLIAIKEAGFKSIINNRPDGEMPGQPLTKDLSQLFKADDLEYCHIPVTPGQLSPELVASMAEALEKMPKPILAFCASGTRSTILWCCANVKEKGVDEVLSIASNAGYNLEQIRPLLNNLSQ